MQPWADPSNKLRGSRIRVIYQRAREIQAKSGASDSEGNDTSELSPLHRAKNLMRTVGMATHQVRQTEQFSNEFWAVSKERQMRNDTEQQALVMLSTGDVATFHGIVRDMLSKIDSSETRRGSSMDVWLQELRAISQRLEMLVELRRCAKNTSELISAIPSAVTSKSDIADTLANCNQLMHEATALDAEMTRHYEEMRTSLVEHGFGKRPTCPFLHIMRWQDLREESVTTCNACCESFFCSPRSLAAASQIWACEDATHDPYYLCASCGGFRLSQSDLLRENWRPPIQAQWQEELQQASNAIKETLRAASPQARKRMSWATAIKAVKCIVRIDDKSENGGEAEQTSSSYESSEKDEGSEEEDDEDEGQGEDEESENHEESIEQSTIQIQNLPDVLEMAVITEGNDEEHEEVGAAAQTPICFALRRAVYSQASAKCTPRRRSTNVFSRKTLRRASRASGDGEIGDVAAGYRASHANVFRRKSLVRASRASGDGEIAAELSRALISRKYIDVLRRIRTALKLSFSRSPPPTRQRNSEDSSGALDAGIGPEATEELGAMSLVREAEDVNPPESLERRGGPVADVLELDMLDVPLQPGLHMSPPGSAHSSFASSLDNDSTLFQRPGRRLAVPRCDAEARVESARRWALALNNEATSDLVLPSLPPLRPPAEYRPVTVLPALPSPAALLPVQGEGWRLAPSGTQLGLTERWRSPRQQLEQENPEEVAAMARRHAAAARVRATRRELILPSSAGRNSESNFSSAVSEATALTKPASDPMVGTLFSRCVHLDDTTERHGIYEAALRRGMRGR